MNISNVRFLADSATRHSGYRPRITKMLRSGVFKQLKKMVFGQLRIIEGKSHYVFSGNHMSDLCAEIQVTNDQFYSYVALGGSVGAGEAYINGYWKSDNLTDVIRLFAVNQSVMDNVEDGIAKLTSPLKKFLHRLNKNTQKGSKRNIVGHYDLGNQFFETFLDPTMMYSSGIFRDQSESMEQASLNKLDHICQKLRLNSSDRVIEIGSGWGAFAIHAAQNFGCHVTTTTISEEQYDYVDKKIKLLGLVDKITLLKMDYRKLSGHYSKLVSIEMIEAVGHHFYDQFFNKCSDLLEENGEMLLQAITITDQRYEAAKADVDFIKKYIFPGSCIPSIDAMSRSITRSTNLRLLNLEDIGLHYAKTLEHWRNSFFSNIHIVREQGFSEAFIRMWEFYLCYCEGGFRERVISDVHIHLVKPLARVPAN